MSQANVHNASLLAYSNYNPINHLKFLIRQQKPGCILNNRVYRYDPRMILFFVNQLCFIYFIPCNNSYHKFLLILRAELLIHRAAKLFFNYNFSSPYNSSILLGLD